MTHAIDDASHWVEFRRAGDGPWEESQMFDSKSEAEEWAHAHLGDELADVHVHAAHDGEPDTIAEWNGDR